MASIVFNLDTRSKSSLKQIRLRISHNHTAAFIPTGVMVSTEDFIGDLENPIAKNAPMYFDKVMTLYNYVSKFQSVMAELGRTGDIQDVDANDIRDLMLGTRESMSTSKTIPFLRYMEDYGKERDTDSSRRSYTYSVSVIKEFCDSQRITHNFPIKKLDYAFLTDLDKYMQRTGRGISTRGIIMRNTKAAFNDAEKRGYAKGIEYPFKKFKIKKKKKTEIEYLEESDMQRLLSLDFTDLQGCATLTRARDIFMISYYMCGVNLKDIFYMPKMDGDELKFQRGKIKRFDPPPLHIRIMPELQKLIDKYKGEKHLFNFCETGSSYDTFHRNTLERMSRISAYLGKTANFKICRHTWATICHKNGVDKYTISMGIGHTDSNDVTSEFYINFDWSKVDEANRIARDVILNGVVPNSISVPKYVR